MTKNTSTIIVAIILRALSASGSIILALIAGNVLGLEQFGTLIAILSTSTLISMALRYGGDKLSIRHYLEEKFFHSKKLIVSQVKTSIIFLSISTFFLSLFFKDDTFSRYIYVIPISALLMVSYNLTALGIGTGKTHYASITQLGFAQFILASGIWLMHSIYRIDLNKVVISIIPVLMLLILSSAMLQKRNLLKIFKTENSAPLEKAAKKERFNFFISGLGGTFQAVTLYALLSIFITPDELGEFRYLERIAAILSLITIFQNIIIPKFIFSDGKAKLNSASILKIRKAQTISIAFILITIILGVIILAFLFDNHQARILISYQWFSLIIVHAIIGFVGPVNIVLLYSREDEIIMKTQLIYMIFSFLLYPLSYKVFGIDGVYFVFFGSNVIRSIFLYLWYLKLVSNI